MRENLSKELFQQLEEMKGRILDLEREKKELQMSREHYRLLVDQASDGFFVFDPKGQCREVNLRGAEILGYGQEELLKMGILDLIPEEEREDKVSPLSQGNPCKVLANPNRLKGKDGSFLPVETTIGKMPKGYFFLVVRDLRMRVKVEAALEEAYHLLESIFNHTHFMMACLDSNFNFVMVNQSYARAGGKDPSFFVGKNHFDLYPYRNQEEIFRQVVETGEAYFAYSKPFQYSKDFDKVRYWDLSLVPLEESTGKVVGLVLTLVDVTEPMETQRELEKSQREKEALQAQFLQSQKMEAIGRLAGGIAHDFNNLLTAILGYSDLLQARIEEDSPHLKSIHAIGEVGRKAASLTHQLLAFSRKQMLQPVVVSLNDLIQGMDVLIHRLISSDIAITISLEPQLKKVKVDPTQIEQVILNLVVNAQTAMPQGGQLFITTENAHLLREKDPSEGVCLSVRDTGVGMEPQVLAHIFEPFFTTRGRGDGTGLGLSTVYGIVRQHEGWIEVESKPKEGALFKIYLPASEEYPEEQKKEVLFQEELRGDGEKILVVEDSEEVRGFIATALEENGYRIFASKTARGAFDLFEAEGSRFDLVFTDVILPDETGLDLVEKLLAVRSNLKVLFCSGYSEEKSLGSQILGQGFPLLKKPYDLKEVLKIIKKVLEK